MAKRAKKAPTQPRRGLVITIDGPAGTGKSTAARHLAKRLDYLYLDTGAMYRAVALKALETHTPLTDPPAVARLARQAKLTLTMDQHHQVRILLDGKDGTEAIRRPYVAEAASEIAVIPAVRRALVRRQRQLGARGRVVADGRDTGTVVFPHADLKFFLTASLPERARRRHDELRSRGYAVTLADVLQETKKRDHRDRTRTDSPLRMARGAILIDNTRLQSSTVLDILIDYVRQLQEEPTKSPHSGLNRTGGRRRGGDFDGRFIKSVR